MISRMDNPIYREDVLRVLADANLDSLAGKRILVTGATGLLGTFLIDVLAEANRRGANTRVLAIGRNRKRAEQRLGTYGDKGGISFVEHDVRNPLPPDLSFDIAVGGASLTHPLDYSEHPIETILTNVEGTRNLLTRAYECKAVVLFLSSVEIYGNSRDGKPFTEQDTGFLDLSTARAGYTESKRVAEALCQAYAAERGLNIRIARLCRIFGPTVLDTDTKASSQFIRKAVSGEDIVLKSEGLQRFSYLHVSDAVSALLTILARGKPGQAYNVSSPECDVQLRDFAECAAKTAGTSVVFDLPPAVERRGYSIASMACLDASELRSLGWTPRLDFETAVQRTVAVLRSMVEIGNLT